MSTLGDVNVGDVVYLRVDGEDTPFRVIQHGKPDSSYDDSYLDGTILCLDYSAEAFETQMVENTGDSKGTYAASYLHQVLNSIWLAKLDEDMQEQVIEVKLPYRTDTNNSPYEAANGGDGLPAKVWVPSIAEITVSMLIDDDGEWSYPYVEEGSLFTYWKDAIISLYGKWQWNNANGRDGGWGTRTPNQAVDDYEIAPYFYKILGNGQAQESSANAIAVRPCLVLPQGLTVDSENRVEPPGMVPVKVGGAWKMGSVWSKVGGVWSAADTLAVKVDGVWKE